MTVCPYCGSNATDYIGVEMDWDDLTVWLVDNYRCMSCGLDFSTDDYLLPKGTDDETKPSHDNTD